MTDQSGPWFVNRGLFSDHFLEARLPESKEWKVDAELVPFRASLQALYESKKSILPHLNEAQTELEFVQPILDLLGCADSYIVQAPTRVGQHTNRADYALFPDVNTKNKAYQKLGQNDYALCIGIADAKYWDRELDLTKSSDRDTLTNQNPSFQIAGYLTGTRQYWGILTNGRLWRLYSSKSHLPLGNYYQVDLVQLLEEAPVEIFKYFYVLFRKQALFQAEAKSLLDRILEGSEEHAVELEADIKERAYGVVELLCRGFSAGFAHKRLSDAALKDIYDNSPTLLYRLLFVFYAEARELLPLSTNASYRKNYSLRKLIHDIDDIFKKGYELSTGSTQYYYNIISLFHLISNGDPKLGVPEYNGGLFDPVEHPFLEKQAIPDAYLVQAIHQLAQITDKKLRREVAVDYNTLSERHLGSIYEGLLEFKPMIASCDLVIIKDKGGVKYAPSNKHPGKKVAYRKDELYLANDKGERKASGSYYTPEYIVNYIVENTLDPLVQEAHDKVKALKPAVDKAIEQWRKLKEQKQGLEPTEKYERKIAEESERLLKPYLSVKVLDPAMGSGHFLARATDFLAEAIATDRDIKSPLELSEESELTYYRRRIVESCIYGVDLNPLAGESCGKLFIGGILPGLVLSALFSTYVAITSWRNPKLAPALSMEERAELTWKRKVIDLRGIAFPVGIIIAVFTAIFTGMASITESAGFGAFLACICAATKRQLNWKNFLAASRQTVIATAMVMWTIFGAQAFVTFYIAVGGGEFIRHLILGTGLGPYGVLAIIMGILIFLRCFIDWVGIMLLCVPIFLPIIKAVGFDPLWFGIIYNVNMQMSFLSPPFGYALFYMKGVTPPGISMEDIIKAALPFLGLQFLGLLICIRWPIICLYLPNLVFVGFK